MKLSLNNRQRTPMEDKTVTGTNTYIMFKSFTMYNKQNDLSKIEKK